MRKILRDLKWINPESENPNDISFTLSPTHDYTIERTDTGVDVRTYNRITGRSGRVPDFDTCEDVQAWVENIHAEEKIQEWCNPPEITATAKCCQWFEVANPEPVLENVVVQTGVHCEEVAEMFDALGEDNAAKVVREVAARYKDSDPQAVETMADILLNMARLDAFTDSMLDQVVTSNGSMSNMGIGPEKLLKRVNASNFSKFVDGKAVRLTPNGKIQKGPDAFKPELFKYLEITGDKLLESLKPYDSQKVGFEHDGMIYHTTTPPVAIDAPVSVSIVDDEL